MAITSSTILEDRAQVDGRRSVVEQHIDHLGRKHLYRYLARADEDVQAILAARVAGILEGLKSQEIATNVGNVMQDGRNAVLSFDHSTIAENRSALRDAFTTATRVEAIMIGDFLASLTNAQLQSLFGLTAGQATALRTNKLTPAATTATAIRAAAGE